MKKKIFIVLSILAVLLVLAASVTSYIDSARVRNAVEPKFAIKTVTNGGNKVTYWGLGYKIIRYPSVSPNEPYKNNRGVKYGNWFMKYEAPTSIEEKMADMKNISTDISDISPIGATITIKDATVPQNLYGQWYEIEKKIDGNWFKVETVIKEYGFNDLGYLPDKNNEVKFKINWEWLYGKLPQGHYRILKEVNNQYIAIEFEITT